PGAAGDEQDAGRQSLPRQGGREDQADGADAPTPGASEGCHQALAGSDAAATAPQATELKRATLRPSPSRAEGPPPPFLRSVAARRGTPASPSPRAIPLSARARIGRHGRGSRAPPSGLRPAGSSAGRDSRVPGERTGPSTGRPRRTSAPGTRSGLTRARGWF